MVVSSDSQLELFEAGGVERQSQSGWVLELEEDTIERIRILNKHSKLLKYEPNTDDGKSS